MESRRAPAHMISRLNRIVRKNGVCLEIYMHREKMWMNRTGKREKNEQELALWPNRSAKERGEKEKAERKRRTDKRKGKTGADSDAVRRQYIQLRLESRIRQVSAPNAHGCATGCACTNFRRFSFANLGWAVSTIARDPDIGKGVQMALLTYSLFANECARFHTTRILSAYKP